MKNQLLILWMPNISDQFQLELQLKLLMLSLILDHQTYGFLLINVGYPQLVISIKLIIQKNLQPIKLMELKLIFNMDQVEFQVLFQMNMLLLLD